MELRGDADIHYDVAREQLIGSGASVARQELRRAIVKALHELGITKRLNIEGKSPIEDLRRGIVHDPSKFKPLEAEIVLTAVLREIPSGPWPLGLHRLISERLGISSALAYRAISTLLATNRTKKGETIDRGPSRPAFQQTRFTRR